MYISLKTQSLVERMAHQHKSNLAAGGSSLKYIQDIWTQNSAAL